VRERERERKWKRERVYITDPRGGRERER